MTTYQPIVNRLAASLSVDAGFQTFGNSPSMAMPVLKFDVLELAATIERFDFVHYASDNACQNKASSRGEELRISIFGIVDSTQENNRRLQGMKLQFCPSSGHLAQLAV